MVEVFASLIIPVFVAALVVWTVVVQRDLRREFHEIYANVVIPSVH